jgi:hypothetical protein
MAKVYTSVPTKDDWLRDLGLKGTGWFWADKDSPFSAIDRITKLVEEFNQEVSANLASTVGVFVLNARLMVILYYMYYHSKWLFHKFDPAGGALTRQQLDKRQAKLGPKQA